jgi:hypothetical protein
MKSLYDKVYDVINQNTIIYDENEFQIQFYLSKRWRDVFKFAAEAEGSEFEELFPPPITIVADLAADEVKDHKKFISDLEMLIRYLSKGGRIINGELA